MIYPDGISLARWNRQQRRIARFESAALTLLAAYFALGWALPALVAWYAGNLTIGAL